MDTSGKEIQGTIDSMKNMVEAMLYTIREQIKTLRNAEDQLYFFQEQLEGTPPKEDM